MKDALGHGSDAKGSHASKIDALPGKYRVANDVTDAHRGDIYGSVYAEHAATGRHVGSIDYSASNKGLGKEVRIQMIRVADDHQHQGVASQMMDRLQQEFTREGRTPTIHWGGTTPEGSAFRKAYYRKKAGK